MACDHETIIVTTVETVVQRYYPDVEEWGKTLGQDVKKLVEATCDECGADFTEQIRQIIWA